MASRTPIDKLQRSRDSTVKLLMVRRGSKSKLPNGKDHSNRKLSVASSQSRDSQVSAKSLQSKSADSSSSVKSKLSKHVLLPKDQSSRPDLLHGLITSMMDLVDNKSIRIDGADAISLDEKDDKKPEHPAKVESGLELKENFFGAIETGKIGGMVDMDEYRQTEEFYHEVAEKLSTQVEKFVEDLTGSFAKGPGSIRASTEVIAEDAIEREHVSKEEVEAEEVETEYAECPKVEDESRKEVDDVSWKEVDDASRKEVNDALKADQKLPAIAEDILQADWALQNEKEAQIMKQRTIDNTKGIPFTYPGQESEVPRESVFSTAKPELTYSFSRSRLNILSDTAVTADFLDAKDEGAFLLPDDYGYEDAEEEAVTVVEEEPPVLDRTPYYAKYDEMCDKLNERRIKNNILQKKVAMYLKRRRVRNYIKDTCFPFELIINYQKKLNEYQQAMEVNAVRQEAIEEELRSLVEKRDRNRLKLDRASRAIQHKESNIGKGLVFANSRAVISDQLIEKLIRRQKVQMDQVATMRLKYIKLKDMVEEKLNLIEKINQLEEHRRLEDYDQLKRDNRSYADRIEEREEELVRIRWKCQNVIQLLAHMREKSSAIAIKVDDLREENECLAATVKTKRARLSHLKRQRVKYRHLIEKLKTESGILIQPGLLRDMQEELDEVVNLEKTVEICREEVEENTINIRNLRKNIERLKEGAKRRKKPKFIASHTNVSFKSGTSSKDVKPTRHSPMPTMVYKSRPLLAMPTIQSSAFIDLVRVKPNPVTQTRRRR